MSLICLIHFILPKVGVEKLLLQQDETTTLNGLIINLQNKAIQEDTIHIFLFQQDFPKLYNHIRLK